MSEERRKRPRWVNVLIGIAGVVLAVVVILQAAVYRGQDKAEASRQRVEQKIDDLKISVTTSLDSINEQVSRQGQQIQDVSDELHRFEGVKK